MQSTSRSLLLLLFFIMFIPVYCILIYLYVCLVFISHKTMAFVKVENVLYHIVLFVYNDLFFPALAMTHLCMQYYSSPH